MSRIIYDDQQPTEYDEAEVLELFDALEQEDDNVAIQKVSAETGLTPNQLARFRHQWADEVDGRYGIGVN